ENASLVHLFNLQKGTLQEGTVLRTLERPDGPWLDGFGESLAMYERNLVIGVAGDDRASEPDTGSAIVTSALAGGLRVNEQDARSANARFACRIHPSPGGLWSDFSSQVTRGWCMLQMTYDQCRCT
ncbi:MAG: hypothetical protein ACOC0P_08140, partial [Planctomycetota bacterium]